MADQIIGVSMTELEPDDLPEPDKILLSGSKEYTLHDLQMALRAVRKYREEIERLRAEVRPSLEVLQRMANGVDPFDHGRFKCAMAALPHEVPKLSASVSMIGEMGIGAKLDFFNRQRQARERGLTVVEGGPEPAA